MPVRPQFSRLVHAKIIFIFLSAAALVAGTGCARRFPSERIPQMKVLLLPFRQPPSMSSDPRAIRGWWFSARTIRQNPRAGATIADGLNRAMANEDYMHLYSPIEIKYYFADKKKLLKDSYSYLEDKEIESLLS